jgi:hypothetical protein
MGKAHSEKKSFGRNCRGLSAFGDRSFFYPSASTPPRAKHLLHKKRNGKGPSGEKIFRLEEKFDFAPLPDFNAGGRRFPLFVSSTNGDPPGVF